MNAFMLFLEVDPLPVGLEFEHAPLHCTLMPWFWTSTSVADIEQLVRTTSLKYRPLTLVSDRPALFGPNYDVPVHVLKPDANLQKLHLELFEMLNALGVRHSEPRYAGPRYRMHVSTHGDRSFSPGKSTVVQEIYLIRAIDEKKLSPKRVVSKINFG